MITEYGVEMSRRFGRVHEYPPLRDLSINDIYRLSAAINAADQPEDIPQEFQAMLAEAEALQRQYPRPIDAVLAEEEAARTAG